MYDEKELLKMMVELFCYLHNEPHNFKPSVWKKFVNSFSDSDLECVHMDTIFTDMKLKVSKMINMIVGKDVKLKTGFLTNNINTTKIIEYIENNY